MPGVCNWPKFWVPWPSRKQRHRDNERYKKYMVSNIGYRFPVFPRPLVVPFLGAPTSLRPIRDKATAAAKARVGCPIPEAPRRTTRCAAGRPEDSAPVGASRDSMQLAMAWGGKGYADAACLAPAADLDALTARMQAHHDPIARRDFVLGLLRRDGRDALPMLERFACDPDILVRWAVAQPGAVWGDICGVALSKRLSNDPSPVVRQALARSLAVAPGPGSIALLCRMADDSDMWVRLSLVVIFGQLGDHPAAQQALMRRLDDHQPWVRANALQTLVQHARGAAVLDALAKVACHDPEAWVRRTALRELALLHPWRARLTLARMRAPDLSLFGMIVRFSPEVPIRLMSDAGRFFEAQLTLGPRRFDHLADVVRDPRSSGTAKYAAQQEMLAQAREALAQVASGTNRQGVNLQRAFAQSSDAARQMMCDKGLVGTDGEQPTSSPTSGALTEAQASSALLDPLRPILALDSLPSSGASGVSALFPVIDMAQQSVDPMARSHVAWLLADVCEHPNAWPLLAAMLDDPSTQVRQQVANVVLSVAETGRLANKQLLPLAKRLLSDAHADVRKAAVGALGKIDTPDVRGLLWLAACDPDPAVRVASVRPWGRLDPHSVTFAALAADDDGQVRSAVATSLANLPFSAMHLAFGLLRQPLIPAAWRQLTQALAACATGPDSAAFARETSLLIIDSLRSTGPELAEAEHGLRTRLLVDALLDYGDGKRPPTMLLNWVAQMHLAPKGLREEACYRLLELRAYPGRDAVFAELLESPADDVRDAARRIMGDLFGRSAGA